MFIATAITNQSQLRRSAIGSQQLSHTFRPYGARGYFAYGFYRHVIPPGFIFGHRNLLKTTRSSTLATRIRDTKRNMRAVLI
jgi:hypothetical protein